MPTTQPFTITIETEYTTYAHSYHLGTIEGVARFIAEEYMASREPPKNRGRIIATIGLHQAGKLVDVLSSDGLWESQR